MTVALHGFTGSCEMWDGIPCTALPILGHNKSRLATVDETFSQEIDKLASLLPMGAHHLLGYSMGARLSLAIAVRFPTRVHALTLIGGTPGLDSAFERSDRIAQDKKWSDLLRKQGIDAFVKAWESLPLWNSQSRVETYQLHQQRTQRLEHSPVQLARALDALGTGSMPSLWESLPELKIPVHLLVGEEDAKFLTIAQTMMTRLPNVKLSVIGSAGHNPLLEQPAETIATIGLQSP